MLHNLCRTGLFALLALGPLQSLTGQTRQSISLNADAYEAELTHGNVYAIRQDKTGFIWFATEDGVNRFDGLNMLAFRPEDTPGLSSGNISTMVHDRTGVLWLSTWGGGLVRLDPTGIAFENFRHKANELTTLADDFVQVLLVGVGNDLWMGTRSAGLNRLNTETGHILRYPIDGPGGLHHPRVWSLAQDPGGGIWVGTGSGLSFLDRISERFLRMPELEIKFGPRDREIRALYIAGDGTLWLGGYEGLSSFDPRARKYTYHPPFPDAKPDSEVNAVNKIYEDRNGKLWIGLLNGGLCYFDRETNHYTFIVETGRTSNADVRDIIEDFSGNLWVATRGTGARMFNPRADFEHFQHDPLKESSLSHNRIKCFTEDGFGRLWVGTGMGLNLLESDRTHFKKMRWDDTGMGADLIIKTLLEDSHGTLWVGSEAGLSALDTSGKRRSLYRHNPADPTSLIHDDVLGLLEDNHRRLWIGTRGGLARFEQGRFINVTAETTLQGKAVLAQAMDSENRLWLGTESGLARYHPQDGELRIYQHNPQDPHSIPPGPIHHLLMDNQRQDLLWLASNNGFAGFSTHSDQARRYTTRQGLAHDEVMGILEDENGFLWLSTGMGISRFHPEQETFDHFTVSMGVQGHHFYPGSCYRAKDGWLAFGGVNGFNRFYPDKMHLSRFKPLLVFTEIKTNKQRLTGPEIAAADNTLALAPEGNEISFSFAMLDYTDLDRNTYACILEGFETAWHTPIGSGAENFHRLPPGDYVFRVKGKNALGLPVAQEARFGFRVTSSYLDNPARLWPLGLLLILLAGIVAVNRLKRQASAEVAQPDPPEPEHRHTSQLESEKEAIDWFVPSPKVTPGAYKGVRRKILVIDPHLKNRLALDHWLGSLGFDVVCAEQPEHAAGLITREQPDLILLDYSQVKEHALLFPSRIRAEMRHPAVVIAAGGAASVDSKNGFDAVISKPMRYEHLLDLMNTHLGLVWQAE